MSAPRRVRLVTWFTPALAIAAAVALSIAIAVTLLSGCAAQPRAAVSLKLDRPAAAPRDASVTIDEEYVGPLWIVAARGVRLPVGEHRISVEREGYFPWDRKVVADRDAIHLMVELVPIPD